MIEIAISICVAVIIIMIYLRYKNVFSLPFFWAIYFLFQYLGLLQVRGRFGGNSYAYAAVAFGTFYAGLLAVDLFPSLRGRFTKKKQNYDWAARGLQKTDSKSKPESRSTSINLMFPELPLNVGLFVALLFATIVSMIFFGENGIPILSSFPAMAWIRATTGIVNRVMTIFGPGCFASLGLVGWAIHRETGSRAARAMTYIGLGLGILSAALLATKAAAILIFIWFNIMLFYLNKKREFRKTLLPLIIVVIPMSSAIVAVRLLSTQGYWASENLYQTYYKRVTEVSAGPVDFIFRYMNRFGPLHGGALHRELERIKDQVTGQAKTPVMSEFVYDLMNEESTNKTGLSAALTLYATGYLEWGLAGMLIYSLFQGIIFGWVHRYLMRQETMSLVKLIVWGGVVSYLIAVSGTGAILVGIEGTLLNIIPPLALILPFGFIFLLPVSRRYRSAGGRRVSRVPQV